MSEINTFVKSKEWYETILIFLNSIYVWGCDNMLVFSFQVKPLPKTIPRYFCLHTLDINSFDNNRIKHSCVSCKISEHLLCLTNIQFQIVLDTPLNTVVNILLEMVVIVVSYLSCQYRDISFDNLL